jgi:hypothetical protein
VITNLLLDLVNVVVGALDALLPHFTIPSWLTAGGLIPTSVEQFIAAALFAVNGVFPSAAVIEIFIALTTLWPAIFAYVIFQWIYKHIPTIAGFGPGAG